MVVMSVRWRTRTLADYSACLLKRLGRVRLPLRFQPSRPLLIGLWLYDGLIVAMVVIVF
jgi:hypothetical protein